MPPVPDLLALVLFLACWMGLEPLTRHASRSSGLLNSNMSVVRVAWMRAMVMRDTRLVDGQLMGHVINSGSFFASSNLILIAAAAGAIFGGDHAWEAVASIPIVESSSRTLFEMKLGLVVLCLVRSLLDFIWSIRQMNYCLAAIGASPEQGTTEQRLAYADAVAAVLNPALSSFNTGVRGYYFALAAASWVMGAVPFALVTIGTVGLLVWRQGRSRSAKAIGRLRELVEDPKA
jgi:uncharacterized membrane protein